jgi:hypothetical protein
MVTVLPKWLRAMLMPDGRPSKDVIEATQALREQTAKLREIKIELARERIQHREDGP